MKKSLFNIIASMIFFFIILAPSCPKSPDSYIEAGRKYYEKKDYVKSYRNYCRAIKLNPILYQAYWERANVEIKMDSLEKAIDDMTSYIESSPERVLLEKAYIQRAGILSKMGYKREACDDWDSVCVMNLNSSPYACQQYRLNCK